MIPTCLWCCPERKRKRERKESDKTRFHLQSVCNERCMNSDDETKVTLLFIKVVFASFNTIIYPESISLDYLMPFKLCTAIDAIVYDMSENRTRNEWTKQQFCFVRKFLEILHTTKKRENSHLLNRLSSDLL